MYLKLEILQCPSSSIHLLLTLIQFRVTQGLEGIPSFWSAGGSLREPLEAQGEQTNPKQSPLLAGQTQETQLTVTHTPPQKNILSFFI